MLLLYFPVKFLLGLKLICKTWNSLISNPYFRHAHTICSIKKDPRFLSPSSFFISNSFNDQVSNIFLPKRGREPSLPSLSFLGNNFRILWSGNGLLLCRLSGGRFCVSNPTTGKLKILPSATVDGEYQWTSPFTLGFDPLRSTSYRIVCFKRFKKESPESTGRKYYFQIFMYLSEMVTWKANTCFEVRMCEDLSAGVFSNEAVHWICHEQYIRLDINEGKVMLITLPFTKWVHVYSWQIGCLWQWDGSVYCAIDKYLKWSLHELDQVTFKWTRQKYIVTAYHLLKDVVRAITKGRRDRARPII